MNRFSDRRIWPKERTDCGFVRKLASGFADFENTVDRGSAVIFDAHSRLCLSYVRILGPKRNLDHRSFCHLGRNLSKFIQIISFFVKEVHLN